MKLGLVGFPQVGKRTLFKLLTGQSADANRPMGTAKVRDARFEDLVERYKPAKISPAQMDFVLLPDLGQEAQHNSEILRGLDEVDVICHLVRRFEDDTIFHLAGKIDSSRDIRLLNEELLISDQLFVEKRLERLAREVGKNDQRLSQEADLLPRLEAHLEAGNPLRKFSFSPEEEKLVASYPFLSRKPFIVILNGGEDQLGQDPQWESIRNEFAPSQCEWFAVSAKIEEELDQLAPEERRDFLDDLGLAEPAIDRLTQLCYQTLGLISFFTVGEDEVRAWTIPQGALAPQAGRVIHSDIERGFIRAEVMKYADLAALGSEQELKKAGKLQAKGKDYPVEDGDILHFLFKA